jgi:hypothetical protein
MLQRQHSHVNGRKLDRRQVLASDIFCVWLRLALCCEQSHSHDSVWPLIVACTICYIIVHMQKVEIRVQTADRCALWKISNGEENIVMQALKFQEVGVRRKFPDGKFIPGPLHIASGRTARKTSLPTVTLLLYVCPLPSDCSGIVACLYSPYVAMDVSI